jgi:two-component system sensor histidine kinase UhpB
MRTKRSMAARWDAMAIVLVSVAAAIVCVRFDLSEHLMAWAYRNERYQVDELPAVLLVIATCLIWFSLRRYAEAKRQLALRWSAELGLTEALAENQRLAQQYLDMQEYERKALARDLHDELGQYLNVIKLDAVAIRDAAGTVNVPVNAAARGLIETVDRVYAVVAGLIHQLRPVAFDELGVQAALEHCVGDWQVRLGKTAISLIADDSLSGLDEVRALALFRLVQEAVTNVARHSNAKNVEIKINTQSAAQGVEGIALCVADDGSGMDLNVPRRGLGLIGMRERVAAFGGTFELTSRPGQGFKMTAFIPYIA